jgi:hypothetical protein
VTEEILSAGERIKDRQELLWIIRNSGKGVKKGRWKVYGGFWSGDLSW